MRRQRRGFVSSRTTEIKPPGSDYVWRFGSGGQRTQQAYYKDANGNPTIPKQGGGSWSAYGSVSVTSTNPFCSSAG